MAEQINLTRRPRRNRRNEAMRGLVRENILQPQNLILPLFVQEGENVDTPIQGNTLNFPTQSTQNRNITKQNQ